MSWRYGLIVTCEHASNAVPEDLPLGVPKEVLGSHVAWDPGAADVAQTLAQALNAPLFLGEWTRLVADLNRSPDNPEVVPTRAFGVDVPGNFDLSSEARRARVERFHAPYWRAVQAEIDRLLETHEVVCHISVHSFTEIYEGRTREVDFGFLIDPDRVGELGLANELRDHIAGVDLDVRVNEPYDGRADALTTALRARYPASRYLGVEIELSQRHQPRWEALRARIVAAFRRLEMEPSYGR